MRVITWNCDRGKHTVKFPSLLKLKPDIAIVQETPKPVARLECADYQLWHGTNVHQGLLVLSFNGWQLEQASPFRKEPQFFLPVRVKRNHQQFNLLAVWIKAGTKYPQYRSTILDGLRTYNEFIRSSPTVLVGDLNTDECKDEISKLGLVSAYHDSKKVEIGSEKHPTFYLHRNQKKPYHYDYCYVPLEWRRRIESVKVGSYAKWRDFSDHCPIVVNITDSFFRRESSTITPNDRE
jgi:exonuclease III